MKKHAIMALIVAFVIPCSGQKLAQKIPSNAQYVFTLNTPNMLRKMSMVEMEKLPIVHDAVEAFSRDRRGYRRKNDPSSTQKYLGLAGLGFDFNQSSYAFVETTDSVTYFGFIIALNDKVAFEALNDSSMKSMNIGKKVKAIGKRKELIAWDKKMALFIGVSKKSSYFREHPEIYERYNMPADTSSKKRYSYYGRYDDQNKILKIWLTDKAKSIFAKKSKKIKPHKFTEHTDNNAACSIWSSSGSFYSQYMNMIGGILDPKNGTEFPGGDLVYHMYINEKDITMKSSITLEEKDFTSYQNIFNNKVNPKFFDYIDADHFLSYYSQAYSVQGALEEVPHLVNNYLGSNFDKWGIQESVDLLAVVLDEEAIGKVVVGDAILILTDIGEQEITYIDYEWDEDYIERKEIEKTKKEVVPEFLYMMSTKDEASVHKIFKLSMKANKKRFTKKELYNHLKDRGVIKDVKGKEVFANPLGICYAVTDDEFMTLATDEQNLIFNNKEIPITNLGVWFTAQLDSIIPLIKTQKPYDGPFKQISCSVAQEESLIIVKFELNTKKPSSNVLFDMINFGLN
ncbi:MAG: hypothetical protein COA97_09790 [Flavobacteriales bacterium]|nr:MAG: hypothetical protein COA97_09790 [Flavobacteriales bacterium]